MPAVMLDIYPVPQQPLTQVSGAIDTVREKVGPSVPIWLVAQSFGGGEGWPREPSRWEERVMVYLSWVHGASGLLYFSRNAGPGFATPSSPGLWAECRQLALEAATLAPALMQPFATTQVPVAATELPTALSEAEATNATTVHVRGIRLDADDTLPAQTQRDIVVLVVNTQARPLLMEFAVPAELAGASRVVNDILRNRTLALAHRSGQRVWTDMLEPMATRAFRLHRSATAAAETTNLIVNPSMEEQANAGTPDGFYLIESGDAGASFLVDGTTAADGRYSMRVTTPTTGQGLTFQAYPQDISRAGRYNLSVWGRGGAALQFSTVYGNASGCTLGPDSSTQWTVMLSESWRRYQTWLHCSVAKGPTPVLQYSVPDKGIAWVDMLSLTYDTTSARKSDSAAPKRSIHRRPNFPVVAEQLPSLDGLTASPPAVVAQKNDDVGAWQRSQRDLLHGLNIYNPHVLRVEGEAFYRMYFFGWAHTTCNRKTATLSLDSSRCPSR